MQEPGETIFVPAGWWHAVLNIGEENIAVTQNWCGRWNLEAVVRDMVDSGSFEVGPGVLRGSVQGQRLNVF